MVTTNTNSTTQRPSMLASVRVVVRELPDALSSGLVPELIEAFVDYSVKWDVTRAACEGHMHLLERLGHREAAITERQMDWAMRVAADKGDLCVMQWLDAYRPQYSISTSVMDSAAFAGNLEVIQWLHEHRSEGCTTHAMDSAAACGHLDIVKWLHYNRSEGCSTAAMDTAAAGGHLRVLQWLDANRKEGCSTVAMDFAIFNGHLHVVQYLNEHRAERCPTSARSPSAGQIEKRQQEARKLVLL